MNYTNRTPILFDYGTLGRGRLWVFYNPNREFLEALDRSVDLDFIFQWFQMFYRRHLVQLYWDTEFSSI